MKFEFETKWTDEGIFTPWFKARYWVLRELGLNGYTMLCFFTGVAITLIALQFKVLV